MITHKQILQGDKDLFLISILFYSIDIFSLLFNIVYILSNFYWYSKAYFNAYILFKNSRRI